MAIKSCENCPSFVEPSLVKSKLGTSYGPNVPYCSSRGIPLGTTKASERELQAFWPTMADECPSYGELPPAKPSQRTGLVGSATVFIENRDPTEESPGSCRDCHFYAEPNSVAKNFGWPIGLCTARGVLVPGRRLSHEPKDCPTGAMRGSRSSFAGDLKDFAVLPVYGDLGPRDMSAPVRFVEDDYQDPRTEAGDAPADDTQKAAGIRAWRKLTHPLLGDKKAPLFLPIFDENFFEEDERAKIPQAGDASHPELYNDYSGLLWDAAVNMIGLDRTPALIGPAGTGKTEFFNYLAWKCQLPFDRISITQGSEVWDILGKHLVEVDPASGESVTNWVDGRLPKRWRKPGVLLIDEPNTGPNEIWQAIRPLTDNSKQLVLDQDRGQKVERHPWCLMGMAFNPAWDLRYIGTNELNEADGNRLGAIWVDYPPENVERNIIVAKCNAEGYAITGQLLDDVMTIGSQIRIMADQGELSVSWGVRLSVAASLFTQFLTLTEAYMMAIGNRLDPDQRELILSVVKGHDTETASTPTATGANDPGSSF